MSRDFLCTKSSPIVGTKAGKLRGQRVDGTYIFQGIKYADAKRFAMPEPVKPWEGVKDALSYGYVCPLLHQEVPNGELMVPHRYWPMNEHCQYLNVWTQSLDAQAKKPVLVWLHGGGFSAGSSIEQVAYDGENLSKFGDVVVVSINHRLNILGYLNLEAYGDEYANSGNAGNADMVMALRWIHDNIAAFGGDPGNVTLFGQSGGGMKVYTLMQTPAADGLFHKGVIQSGVLPGFMQCEDSDGKPLVEAMLADLGFDPGDAKQLETVPVERLFAAYNKVSPALSKQGKYVGCTPVANDFYLGDPREVGFTEHAKTIPVIVGSVMGEFAFGPGIENKYALTEDEVVPMLREKYGEYTDELIPLFKKAYRDKHLSDLWYLDALFRNASLDFIKAKAVHPESATYSYLFTYEFPYDDGKVAWHCSDIPFFFHNTDKVPICNVPVVSDILEGNMAGALVSFARTGVPCASNMPQWPVCTPEDEAVMIFDRECQVRHNHDHALMAVMAKLKPQLPDFNSEDEVALH